MGTPDHLTCLLKKTCMQVKKQQLELDMEKWTCSKLGKEYVKDLSPCLSNFYADYNMQNPRLVRHKLESRLPGEISVTSDMQMMPPKWQKVKRNSLESLDEGERGE